MLNRVSIIFALFVTTLSCCLNTIAFTVTLPQHSSRCTAAAQISYSQLRKSPFVTMGMTVENRRLSSKVLPIEKGRNGSIALDAHRTHGWSSTKGQVNKILATSIMVAFLLVSSAFAIDTNRYQVKIGRTGITNNKIFLV